ncbi:sulfate transporter family-domain-containing protein [Blastocladiella britannica]|nr:sulfate transporter family-domain-containing protein [Blastocladiella britannica]
MSPPSSTPTGAWPVSSTPSSPPLSTPPHLLTNGSNNNHNNSPTAPALIAGRSYVSQASGISGHNGGNGGATTSSLTSAASVRAMSLALGATSMSMSSPLAGTRPRSPFTTTVLSASPPAHVAAALRRQESNGDVSSILPPGAQPASSGSGGSGSGSGSGASGGATVARTESTLSALLHLHPSATVGANSNGAAGCSCTTSSSFPYCSGSCQSATPAAPNSSVSTSFGGPLGAPPAAPDLQRQDEDEKESASKKRHHAAASATHSSSYATAAARRRVADAEFNAAALAAAVHAAPSGAMDGAKAATLGADGARAPYGTPAETVGFFGGEAGSAFFPGHDESGPSPAAAAAHAHGHTTSKRRPHGLSNVHNAESSTQQQHHRRRRHQHRTDHDQEPVTSDERQPLLQHQESSYSVDPAFISSSPRSGGVLSALTDVALDSLSVLPAVCLGLILNVLDALSFGIILFPVGDAAFEGLGSDGIAIFFVSTIVSQLAFSTMSTFKSGVGSMIIEVIPFLHTICRAVAASLVPQGIDPMPTVMAAFFVSTLLTAVAFFLLGAFRLGNVIGFFPRHILVGSIGGVGYFLLQTAIEVSASVKVEYNREAMAEVIAMPALAQWLSAFGVALVLRAALVLHLDRRLLGDNPKRRGMFVPIFFMLVPLAFHLILWLAKIEIETARANGWLFSLPEARPFYAYLDHIRPWDVRWSELLRLMPTMLSMAFFSILHVPINVPALAVSTNAGVSVNRELANHGVANLAAAFTGSLPNYLVYSTSVMLHRAGAGQSRSAGYWLSILTVVMWIGGGAVMRLVPAVVVGALMFHFGIDLVKEAVWDTRGLVTPLEYGTIWTIILSMALLGFTEGVGIGLILACVFFVVTYSTRAHSAVIARDRVGTLWGSPVRRMPYHRQILAEYGRHAAHVLELQGFLFFGTIHHLTKRVHDLVDPDRGVGPGAEMARKRRRRLVWPQYDDGATTAAAAATTAENGSSSPSSFPDSEESTNGDRPGMYAPRFPPRGAVPRDPQARPRYLVLDFARCQDIDFSAGEAFVKLLRLLRAHRLSLVLAGVGADGNGHMARALQRAGVWPAAAPVLGAAMYGADNDIVCCATLPGALEFVENAVLAGCAVPVPSDAVLALAAPAAYSDSSDDEDDEVGRPTVDPELAVLAAMVLGSSSPNAPTATRDADAALFAARVPLPRANPTRATPVPTAPLFVRRVLPPGAVLWRTGDPADSVLFVLRGALCQGRSPPVADAPTSSSLTSFPSSLSVTAVNSNPRASRVLLGAHDSAAAALGGPDTAAVAADPATSSLDAAAAAARHRVVASLPGTVVGARAFVTDVPHARACWVAPVLMVPGTTAPLPRRRMATEERLAVDALDDQEADSGQGMDSVDQGGEGAYATVVYEVRRDAVLRMPAEAVVALTRMMLRADNDYFA